MKEPLLKAGLQGGYGLGEEEGKRSKWREAKPKTDCLIPWLSALPLSSKPAVQQLQISLSASLLPLPSFEDPYYYTGPTCIGRSPK